MAFYWLQFTGIRFPPSVSINNCEYTDILYTLVFTLIKIGLLIVASKAKTLFIGIAFVFCRRLEAYGFDCSYTTTLWPVNANSFNTLIKHNNADITRCHPV
jgi:hypothetical protein